MVAFCTWCDTWWADYTDTPLPRCTGCSTVLEWDTDADKAEARGVASGMYEWKHMYEKRYT